jgi:hypothetical protein
MFNQIIFDISSKSKYIFRLIKKLKFSFFNILRSFFDKYFDLSHSYQSIIMKSTLELIIDVF